MKMHHISSSSMMLNTYIVIDEKNKLGAVIDPGFDNEALFQYLKNADFQVEYIMATHGHFDHVLLINRVKNEFGGKVVIHEADEEMLRVDNTGFMRKNGIAPPELHGDILLKGGETLEMGDISFQIMHTPGHTKGGICIQCIPYLFTGDTLFHDDVGRTDLEGGSMEELKCSISKVLGKIDRDLEVMPGHEEFSTLAHEKANNPFFKESSFCE